MKELYAPFTRTGAPIMMMDCASAELCKYAANAMLATRISFMNEVANVCEAVGADVDQVRRAVASDRRIGPSFLFPGRRLRRQLLSRRTSRRCMQFAADKDYDFQILRGRRGGQRAPEAAALDKMEAALRVAEGEADRVWGLAFKPRTDDMREAPAVPLIDGAARRAARRCTAYDPEAMKVARTIFGTRISSRDKSYDALTGADALAHRDRVERVPRAGLRANARS